MIISIQVHFFTCDRLCKDKSGSKCYANFKCLSHKAIFHGVQPRKSLPTQFSEQ
jgi:hypothetical protein